MSPVKAATEPILFSGHETFPFRYGWLTKGLTALNDPGIFNREEATTSLGVGKNMVKSIRHWLLACGLATEKSISGERLKTLEATWEGHFIFGVTGADAYLEDISTLWLLHFFLCREQGRAQSWYWLFNHWKNREFHREEVVRELTAFASSAASRANQNTIRRDVDCLLRTYVTTRTAKGKSLTEDSLDCPLAELSLIEEVGDGETYAFQVGDHRTLTSEVFAYCLLDFWQRCYPNQETLAFEQILYSEGSPAKIFKLSYAGLIRHLETIKDITHDAIAFEESSGLRQLYRRRDVAAEQLMKQIYKELALV